MSIISTEIYNITDIVSSTPQEGLSSSIHAPRMRIETIQPVHRTANELVLFNQGKGEVSGSERGSLASCGPRLVGFGSK